LGEPPFGFITILICHVRRLPYIRTHSDRNGSIPICGTDPDHKTWAAPKLNVLAVNQSLGFLDCLGIVGARQRLKSNEMPSTPTVYARYSAIRVYSKGRSSPVRSLATSGDRNGSSPSQPRHWNLRPPVFQSRNRMGLRQFGQIGGGVFLGMTLTLDQARAQNSLSPINAEVRAVMNKV
jgi:hypothetical protein